MMRLKLCIWQEYHTRDTVVFSLRLPGSTQFPFVPLLVMLITQLRRGLPGFFPVKEKLLFFQLQLINICEEVTLKLSDSPFFIKYLIHFLFAYVSMDSWFSVLSNGLESITLHQCLNHSRCGWWESLQADFFVLSSHPHYFLAFWYHKIYSKIYFSCLSPGISHFSGSPSGKWCLEVGLYWSSMHAEALSVQGWLFLSS